MKIYVDLDGVLTDFDGTIQKFFGKDIKEFEKDPDMWAKITSVGEKFWSTMNWMEEGEQLWTELKKYEPTILSSPTRSKSSVEGKKKWLKKNLPGVPYIIEHAKDKYADEDAILIDDRIKNIKKWRQAGGVGILHKNASDTISELNKIMASSSDISEKESSKFKKVEIEPGKKIVIPTPRMQETFSPTQKQKSFKSKKQYSRKKEKDIKRFMEASRKIRWLAAELNKNLPELILTVGIPGSGKSTWIKSKPGYVVINPDKIRGELGTSVSDQTATPAAWTEAKRRVSKALKQGKNVIIDALNTNRFDRNRTLEGLPPHQLKAKIFHVSPEEAKRRIKKDLESGKERAAVPDYKVDEIYEDFKETMDEGQLKEEGFEIIK